VAGGDLRRGGVPFFCKKHARNGNLGRSLSVYWGDKGGDPMVVSIASGHELALSGRIDVHNAADIRDAIHAALDAGTGDLYLDVSEVDLVDPTGLGVLVGAHRRARQLDRRIVLTKAGPNFLRILRMTRLHKVLAVETPQT
jgi:anti-sigma B factor antagonist